MTRIPLDPPRTLPYRIGQWFARRRFGAELDPGKAMGHNLRVGLAYGMFQMRVLRWRSLDDKIKDLAVMATSFKIGCTWCIDFGTWEASTRGLPLKKIEAVPAWRHSDLFTPLERLVMEYAEAMSDDPPSVTDELSAALREHLSDKQLVELTMMIAIENMRSRFNAAAGLTGQGFKDRCEIPAPSTTTGSAAG